MTEPPRYSSAVPTGTFWFPNHLPSTPVPGYFRPSLRDFTCSGSGWKVSSPCSVSIPARAVTAPVFRVPSPRGRACFRFRQAEFRGETRRHAPSSRERPAGWRGGGLLALGSWVKYSPVMRQPSNKLKKPDYPEQTEGSRLAAKVRKLASKLTPEEEADHFQRGLAKIYGGQPKEITGAGH